jgi:hypothetical protein
MCSAKYLVASGIKNKKALLLLLSSKLEIFQIAMFCYDQMGRT